MYIAPNSIVKLYSGVPLFPDYRHTWRWRNESERNDIFATYLKTTIDSLQFVRTTPTEIKINVSIGNCYDVNYISFINTDFGNKTFYAFVTSVDYVSNDVTKLTFQIDVMQTWYFDYALSYCFVEREHIAVDTPGANLQPENLELGEYISNSNDYVDELTHYSTVIATPREGESGHHGIYSNGIYTGLSFDKFNTYIEVNNKLDALEESGAIGSVVSIFMAPTIASAAVDVSGDFTKSTSRNETIDGYTPKNKKLLTAPFNYLYVTNFHGNSAIYPYEYFTDPTNITFKGKVVLQPTVVAGIAPSNYKGLGTTKAREDEAITVTGFPICAWANDYYKQWLALNGNQLAQQNVSSAISSTIGVVGSVGSLGASIVSGNAAGIAISAGGLTNQIAGSFDNIAGKMARHKDALAQPRQSHGNNAGDYMSAMGCCTFGFEKKSITKEYAEKIDNYFEMFGYATNELKIPNVFSRFWWNYIKLSDITFSRQAVPSGDIETIKRIYEKGITFWNGTTTPGDYSKNNHF